VATQVSLSPFISSHFCHDTEHGKPVSQQGPLLKDQLTFPILPQMRAEFLKHT
jgi:hypothetical protein